MLSVADSFVLLVSQGTHSHSMSWELCDAQGSDNITP